MPEPVEVNVWAFAEGERRQVDHLAIVGADATLCGCRVNPHGYPTMDSWDPDVGYSCKRCAASVRKRGPFAVVSRISYNFPTFVSSIVGGAAAASDGGAG
jgi:hypothetical protein